MKVQDTILFSGEVLMIIFQYSKTSFTVSFVIVKMELISSMKKWNFQQNNQVLLTDHYFSSRDDNSKQEKVGSVE